MTPAVAMRWPIGFAIAMLSAVPSAYAAPTYMGCYNDAQPRALPLQLMRRGATVATCVAAAANHSMSYAGLQNGGECWAGNNLSYSRKGESNCATPCAAKPGQICGGNWHNSVYAPAVPPSASVYQTKEISWTPGADIAGVGIGVFPLAATVRSISCRVDALVGKPAVFTVAMTGNGTALKQGHQISPTMCDGNANLATNQPIFSGVLAVPAGSEIGIVADDPLLPAGNIANWLAGSGMGIVTVEYTVP